MPIYLVRRGPGLRVRLLTELSLPGDRLPRVWAVPSSYSLRCEAGAAWRLKLNKKQIQKAEKYDYKLRRNQVSPFNRSQDYEINAGCGWQRFFGQSSKAAENNPFAVAGRSPRFFRQADGGTSQHHRAIAPGTLRPALRRLFPLGIKRVKVMSSFRAVGSKRDNKGSLNGNQNSQPNTL